MKDRSSPPMWGFCFVAMATFVAMGCDPGSPLGSNSEAITYTQGATCNPSDVGSRIACPGDSAGRRLLQYCDPRNMNRATACTYIDCADAGSDCLAPPPFMAADASAASCSLGARIDCTTSDGRFGYADCDATGTYPTCVPYGAAGPTPGGPAGACGGDPRIGTACTSGLGACAATGTYVCTAGMISCNAAVGSPTTEMCDGVDNDCDGTTDELVTRSCYSGPVGTATIGVCRFGTQTCAVGGTGTWGACTGEVLPSPETCGDSIDQDCNGADLGCTTCGGDPRIGMVCSVGLGACTAAGNYACNAMSGVLSCSAMAGMAATETCNNVDDDCDGTVDAFSAACYSGPPGTAGVGICRAGTQLCTAGVFGACTGQVLPAIEICGNGIDEDCNGADLPCVVCGSDPRVGTACSVGLGACLRNGTFGCVAGALNCSAMAGPVASEICNNIDDDCDGAVDDGVTQSCYGGPAGTAGVGICRVGNQVCAAGVFGACTGEIRPGTETCGDGIDQDCSGGDLMCSVCGSDPRVGTACSVGVGACSRPGTYGCSGMTLTCSATAGTPVAETCNNVDDDCNGTVDAFTQACYTGPAGTASVGVCRAGLQTCTTGVMSACAGQILPGAETPCNGVDEDCNGSDFCPACFADPLFGSIGAACSVGTGACQRSGMYVCSPLNTVVCSAAPGTPVAEICGNAVDEDCNGSDFACPVDAGFDAGSDVGSDAGMDAGMDAAVMDAGSDSGAMSDAGSDAGTVVVSGGRYTIEVGGRSCADTSTDARFAEVPGFSWWRFCYTTTDPRPSSLVWTQWGDWTDTSSLPSMLPSVAIPTGAGTYTVNVYMRFSNSSSVTIEPNIQLNGDPASWAIGISGPPTPPTTRGTMVAYRLISGAHTAFTLDALPNVPCTGLNYHPRGTTCRSSTCSYAASYVCL